MILDVTNLKKLLSSFALPARLRHAFEHVGCLTLADALQLTPERLRHIPKSGVTTLQVFLDFLETGLTIKDLQQARQMHLSFGEILGLTLDNEALTDLFLLKQRRISDEEITTEACKLVNRSTLPFEAFRMGARMARQWQSQLLAVTRKITPVMVRASCGHEYKTGILHADEDDLREQRTALAMLQCLSCVEAVQAVDGQVVPVMENRERPPIKIVAGGQTGADRAALDWAIRHHVPHGGYCPKGRRAEDGPIAEHYQLQELPSATYAARTKRNIVESDGTVIFTLKATLTGGTRLTAQHAEQSGKPLLHLCQPRDPNAAEQLRTFIDGHQIRVLNVAGPRATREPEVGAFVAQTLDAWWGTLHS